MDINTCKFVYEKRGNILGRGEGRRILETKRVSSSSFSFVLSLITELTRNRGERSASFRVIKREILLNFEGGKEQVFFFFFERALKRKKNSPISKRNVN